MQANTGFNIFIFKNSFNERFQYVQYFQKPVAKNQLVKKMFSDASYITMPAYPSQLAVISIFSHRPPYKSWPLSTTNTFLNPNKYSPYHNYVKSIAAAGSSWQIYNQLDRGFQQFTESVRGDRWNYVSVRYFKIFAFLLQCCMNFGLSVLAQFS